MEYTNILSKKRKIVKSLLNLDDGHDSGHSEGNTKYLGAATQISNTIMGAGILGLPVVIRFLGLIPGIIFLIINAAVAIYSVSLLLRCKDITGK